MSYPQNITVIGGDFGDEGKGKLIPWLAVTCSVSVLVRYSGGENAGHTVCINGRTVVFHLLPSAAVLGRTCVLASGVRVNPLQVVAELDALAAAGFPTPEVLIDTAAALSLRRLHGRLEWWAEHQKGRSSAGSTMKGMGPIAAAEALRVNPQVGLLVHPDHLRSALAEFRAVFGVMLDHPDVVKALGPTPSDGELLDELRPAVKRLAGGFIDTREYLSDHWTGGSRLLFEGAQGHWLDPDQGTYPFTTSGKCTFAGVAQCTGLPVDAIGLRIAVLKAYATRVGNGPFDDLGDPAALPEELPPPLEVNREAELASLRAKINAGQADDAEVGRYLRWAGHEVGATTGRKRRTGWFNAARARRMIQAEAPHALALTKLDVLSGLRELKVITGYRYPDGRCSNYPPNLAHELAGAVPMYHSLVGWDEDITGKTDFGALPPAARNYVSILERLLGTPIRWIGTGPGKDDLIERPLPPSVA